MENFKIDLENWKYAFEKAKEDRDKYFEWIKNEIDIAKSLINKYNKLYVLGGIGAKLIQASPNLFNQSMEIYESMGNDVEESDKIKPDEEIEVLLEYAMNISLANENENNVIPTLDNINEIIAQLSKIKLNVGFYEMTSELPKDGNEFDHLLKFTTMEDNLHVRGNGYDQHIIEVYKELFEPFDDFLQQFYGFDSQDIFNVINKLDELVVSKIGNPFGSSIAHKRFLEWSEKKGEKIVMDNMKKGKHFITQFLEDNPDLTDGEDLMHIIGIDLDDVRNYDRLFWVIPQTSKEEKIFELLSQKFNDNKDFLIGKFGGFPLGDTTIKTQPLIKIQEKYYSFSTSLAFRNIFEIITNLLEKADSIYYEQNFKNNTHQNSKDNYIEKKTKEVFESFLPKVKFYHSLNYKIIQENGKEKATELDILGIGENHIYIIEVKAGELNSKHKRGALKGLKDRLKETINAGTFQCYRAEKYIEEAQNPIFTYIEENSRKTLVIDKTKKKEIIKISVMFEHFASIAVNLKYLIENGVLSPDYKWTWIVSLYDLMVFRDLIDSEEDFIEYIYHRINLYERNDIEFQDEIDILGFFFEGKFPLNPETTGDKVNIISYRDDIDNYYTKIGVNISSEKPKRK